MKKLKQLKQAIRNTPPERLAKVEYRSHFMQILGVMIVCAILIYKGYWWIIFAFIFSLGVSYSQGVGAYQRYLAIMEIIGNKKYNPNKDKSPTRRMDYIIKKQLGGFTPFITAVISVVFVWKYVPLTTWYMKLGGAMLAIFIYLVIYFIYFYQIANYFERRKKRW